MRTFHLGFTLAAALAVPLGAAQAQHATSDHGAATASMASPLPDACMTGGSAAMHPMGEMSGEMSGDMPAHAQAMMQGAMAAHVAMMQGMMAEDPDVAFACAMIPHHQAAIDMAQVQLDRGADARMRAMAETIIDAQTGEIAELTAWIEERSR